MGKNVIATIPAAAGTIRRSSRRLHLAESPLGHLVADGSIPRIRTTKPSRCKPSAVNRIGKVVTFQNQNNLRLPGATFGDVHLTEPRNCMTFTYLPLKHFGILTMYWFFAAML